VQRSSVNSDCGLLAPVQDLAGSPTRPDAALRSASTAAGAMLPPARRSAPFAALMGGGASRAVADELAAAAAGAAAYRAVASDGEDPHGSECGSLARRHSASSLLMAGRRRSLTARRSSWTNEEARQQQQQQPAAGRLALSTSALPTSNPGLPLPPHPSNSQQQLSSSLSSSRQLAASAPSALVACSWPPPQPLPGAASRSLFRTQQQLQDPDGAAAPPAGAGISGSLQRRRGQRRGSRPQQLREAGALGLGMGMGSRAESMEELGLIDDGAGGRGCARSLFDDAQPGGGGFSEAALGDEGAVVHSSQWFEEEMAEVSFALGWLRPLIICCRSVGETGPLQRDAQLRSFHNVQCKTQLNRLWRMRTTACSAPSSSGATCAPAARPPPGSFSAATCSAASTAGATPRRPKRSRGTCAAWGALRRLGGPRGC